MSLSAVDEYPLVNDLGTLNHPEFRVLHVDDDSDFAALVAVYLERESNRLEVATEHSAEDGLARLEEERFDCIVSDYDMPGESGLAFLETVRKEHGNVPFILFTGKGSEEIASEAISAGVSDYLQKRGGTEQYEVLANRIENVTRRHQAERGARQGFHAIETAREGIAFLDEEGHFVYVNDAYTEVYGYERSELVGEHWEMLYPDEHVEQVYEEILPAVPEAGRWTGESVHVRADGERLVVDHALAYTDEGMILCLIQDITEEKETRRALEEERQRFELFVENVEEYAIFALDTDGFVTSWNQGAERLKGYETDEILGEHFSVFYPDDLAEAGRPDELIETALQCGTATDTDRRVRKDGTTFWADVTITAVFDEDGRHRGYLKVTKDVTEERESRGRLDGDGEFMDRALDVLEDIFYVLDGTGSVVRATDRAVEVTGYSREELESMTAVDLFPDDERAQVREEIEEAIETGVATLEADLVTADGTRIPYEFRKRRLVDEDGNVFLAGVGRDVSDRERRERRLERQLEQFEHFGRILSHDLRTPLETTRGRLELARETGEKEHLRAAESALDRLDELIEDLASVMREGELVSDVGPVAFEDSLRSVWETLETDDATLTVADGGHIRADEEAFKRFGENLFKNALEHGGDDVSVTVGLLPDGFYVEDDGPGIPAAERERVFEPGYSTKSTGSGFGLASVRQLAVAHGWEISITASEEGGARFEVTDVAFDTE